MDFIEFCISVVFSTTFVILIIIFILKNWLLVRLSKSIEHEYNQKLENYKVQLKAFVEKENYLNSSAHAAFSEVQKISMPKRLAAIESLWDFFLKLRSSVPLALTMLDFIKTEEELENFQQNDVTKDMFNELNSIDLKKLYFSEAEASRPFVGEYIWALFSAYQVIIFRRVAEYRLARNAERKLNWYENDVTKSFIKSVFNDSEMKELDQAEAKLSWISKKIELKILEETGLIISGEETGGKSLDQASLIMQKVQEIKNKSFMQSPHSPIAPA